jgi:hypothetical protein
LIMKILKNNQLNMGKASKKK